MSLSSPSDNEHSGLSNLSTDSQAIENYYDDWAEDYDQTLQQWNYQCPVVAAELLKQETPLDGDVLDAGCGTGLSGHALQAAGFQHLTGIDISQESLDLATRTGAYERLMQVNLQQLPLPFDTDAFAGLLCVGVLTYVPDTVGILREFCRVVQPGGTVVFTHRDDLFNKQDRWEKVSVSDPQLYLPGHEEFADKIKVIYCVFRVLPGHN
jgi:predicted TPR repeat methyltransferase